MKLYKLLFVILLTVMLVTDAYQGFSAGTQKEPSKSAAGLGWSSQSEVYPIDQWVQQQLSKDPSTHGEIRAYSQGSKMWDKEVNKIYQEVMKRLDKPQQKSLKQAQENWLEFRETEEKFLGRFIEKMRGSMWLPVAPARLYRLNRQRAVDLKRYLEWTRDLVKD